MKIGQMFAKPIDRDMKGVIKVGQDDNLNIQQELEEYVVTRELQKHFRDFFGSYKRGSSVLNSDILADSEISNISAISRQLRSST